MPTRSGLDASPSKAGSPGNPDGEADDMDRGQDGLRRGSSRPAGRKRVSFADEGQASSSKSPKKSPTKKGPPKEQDAMNAEKIQANISSEPFQHRFSVHRIRDVKFTCQQIGWINEAGFGSLLSMSEVSLPTKLVAFVMKLILELREFRIEKKNLPFDKQLICNILGVPSGSEPVKLNCPPEEYEEYQKIREPCMGRVRGLSISDCIVCMRKSKDQTTFMRAFMLVALGTVLCPGNDNCISAKYLHSLKDVSKIRSFDWAGHILDKLFGQPTKHILYYHRKRCENRLLEGK